MKFTRYILYAIALLLSTLLLSRCDDAPNVEIPNPKETLIYKTLKDQFKAGASLTGVESVGEDLYEITFSDNKKCLVDSWETPYKACAPSDWPSLTIKNGVWHIDGSSSGIAYTDSRDGEKIVLVMYDSEALYVRLSSGYIFYFHRGKVLDIGCFRFERALNPTLTEDIVCTVGSGAIVGEVDTHMSYYKLIATVGSRGELTYGYQTVRSSVTVVDYSSEVSLSLTTTTGQKEFKVTLSSQRRIPQISISTGGRTVPRDTYIEATMRISDPDLLYCNTTEQIVDIEIHGRGNTTWDMPKKPYKIKLAEKQRLMGMSDNKHWTLLANYSDKSLLRNSIAFKLSELSGMAWTPRWRPVEVSLNGLPQGQYMLTEHVRVDSERVDLNVVTPHDNTGNAVTGGYFLWIDTRSLEQGNPGFTTARGLPVSFEEPYNLTSQQRTYIEKFIKQTELDIYNKTFEHYSQIIDIDSFIRYFFVHEIAKDVDGNMRLSSYMTKPRNGKLGFSCVWDFDITFGNCDYNTSGNGPTGWHIRNAIWFRQLFRNPAFVAKVTQEWAEFYPKLSQVEPDMRRWAELMDDAQKRNFQRWNILSIKVWPNLYALGSYQAELDYMLSFFKQRVEWMNNEIKAGRHKN